jgi:hypothetical protein
MSIQGKKREIPPYYRLLGQAEIPLEGPDPHRYLRVGMGRPARHNSTEAIFNSLSGGGWLLSCDKPFIPFNLLLYGLSHFHPQQTGSRSLLDRVAYTALEKKIRAGKARPEALNRYREYSARKWEVLKDFPLVDRLLQEGYDRGTSFSPEDLPDIIRSHVSWLDFFPRFFTLDSGRNQIIGEPTVQTRDQLPLRFKEVQTSSTYFIQRTYKGHLDFMSYFWSRGVYSSTPLHPGILAVVTPENWVYQKLHFLRHGTFDMDRVIILVDRELDNPRTEYPRPVRDLYMEFFQRELLKYRNVWKVPRSFIEEQCLSSIKDFEARRTGSIIQFKQECLRYLREWYRGQLLYYYGESEVDAFLEHRDEWILSQVAPYQPAGSPAEVVVQSFTTVDQEVHNNAEVEEEDWEDWEEEEDDEDEDNEEEILPLPQVTTNEDGNLTATYPTGTVGQRPDYVAGIDPIVPEGVRHSAVFDPQRLGEGLYQQLQNTPVAEYPRREALSETEIARQLDLIAQTGQVPNPNGEQEEQVDLSPNGLLDHLDNLPVE